MFIRDEWYGIINRENMSIFNKVTALAGIEKHGFWSVLSLLFLKTE